MRSLSVGSYFWCAEILQAKKKFFFCSIQGEQKKEEKAKRDDKTKKGNECAGFFCVSCTFS